MRRRANRRARSGRCDEPRSVWTSARRPRRAATRRNSERRHKTNPTCTPSPTHRRPTRERFERTCLGLQKTTATTAATAGRFRGPEPAKQNLAVSASCHRRRAPSDDRRALDLRPTSERTSGHPSEMGTDRSRLGRLGRPVPARIGRLATAAAAGRLRAGRRTGRLRAADGLRRRAALRLARIVATRRASGEGEADDRDSNEREKTTHSGPPGC